MILFYYSTTITTTITSRHSCSVHSGHIPKRSSEENFTETYSSRCTYYRCYSKIFLQKDALECTTLVTTRWAHIFPNEVAALLIVTVERHCAGAFVWQSILAGVEATVHDVSIDPLLHS